MNIYRTSKNKGKYELIQTNKDLGGFGEKGKDYPLKNMYLMKGLVVSCMTWRIDCFLWDLTKNVLL